MMLEPYKYHVQWAYQDAGATCAPQIFVIIHIKLGGGWSFVRELQQHPYVRHQQRSITVKT